MSKRRFGSDRLRRAAGCAAVTAILTGWLPGPAAEMPAPVGALPVLRGTTLNVDTALDDPRLTACQDAVPHDCSLRGAIITANGSPGADTVNVPSGTYVLAPPGNVEDPAATGQLDITDTVTLVGAGASVTEVVGASPGPNLDYRPVFHVRGSIAVHISGLTVRGGSASGIVVDASTLILARSRIVDNSTRGLGGGIHVAAGGSNVTIVESTISRNAARGPGAGIAAGGTLRVLNSTLSGNAGFRSAVYVSGGAAEFNNVTVAGNHGGLESQGGAVSLSNTILEDCSAGATFSSAGYNIIRDPARCTFAATSGDQVGVDPRLAPLADRGGPAETLGLCTGAGVPDVSCPGPSPALDAGHPAEPGSGGATCERTDQRGVARPAGSGCDIGAYEAVRDGSASPAAASAGPSLTLSVNMASVRAGDLVELAIAAANPGAAQVVNVLYGASLPPEAGPAFGCPAGDAAAFRTVAGVVVACLSAPARDLPALARGLVLPGGWQASMTIDSFRWPAAAPGGAYTFFLALTGADGTPLLAASTAVVHVLR